MNLHDRWLAQLEALRAQGRLRSLKAGDGVDFSSNDYLGYAKLPADSRNESFARSGTASRLLRGHHPIWEEVESALARWHGSEAALVMTSGYIANLGLLSTLIEPGDWLASDTLNHASIIDGLKLNRPARQVYRHLDVNQLQEQLREMAAIRRKESASFIITESLFSMEGDEGPVEALAELAAKHEAHLIVDEAHATGCFGSRGSGLVDHLGLRSRVLATVHTGGKALGVPGAYICCSNMLKQLLINRCRQFLFTTALPPIVGQWWLEALKRVSEDEAGRRKLHENTRFLRSELRTHGIMAHGDHYIVSVVLKSDDAAVRAAARLQDSGFDIRAIRPPTVPEGTARLRISIHADHDVETLRHAAAAVAEAVS